MDNIYKYKEKIDLSKELFWEILKEDLKEDSEKFDFSECIFPPIEDWYSNQEFPFKFLKKDKSLRELCVKNSIIQSQTINLPRGVSGRVSEILSKQISF